MPAPLLRLRMPSTASCPCLLGFPSLSAPIPLPLQCSKRLPEFRWRGPGNGCEGQRLPGFRCPRVARNSPRRIGRLCAYNTHIHFGHTAAAVTPSVSPPAQILAGLHSPREARNPRPVLGPVCPVPAFNMACHLIVGKGSHQPHFSAAPPISCGRDQPPLLRLHRHQARPLPHRAPCFTRRSPPPSPLSRSETTTTSCGAHTWSGSSPPKNNGPPSSATTHPSWSAAKPAPPSAFTSPARTWPPSSAPKPPRKRGPPSKAFSNPKTPPSPSASAES